MALTNRSVIPSRLIVDGKPVLINLITGPTIDDVVMVEAQLYAASLDREDPSMTEGRSVPWDIKDYLIRLGVER